MSLKKIREKIDRIDSEILRLLAERLELGLETRALKADVRDADREAEVLERASRFAGSCPVVSGEFAARLFTDMMEESRRLQGRADRLIAFQGEHGAYSETAAAVFDPEAIAVPRPEFAGVFEAVERGLCGAGIVPVENTLGGSVSAVHELLAGTRLQAIAGLRLRIGHYLLARPETCHRDLRIVYSHPQALAQCRGFIERHGLEGVPCHDTAGAARMLARDNPPGAAAIAGRRCARLYGLEVVKENLEDHPGNITRFIVLSRAERAEAANTCSLVFTIPHRAGALFDVLRVFADNGINLTRIESFPDRGGAPERYSFFLDFRSDDVVGDRARVVPVLERLTLNLKSLGCYRDDPAVREDEPEGS